MEMLSALFVAFVISCVYWLVNWINKDEKVKYLDALPGPLRLPILGTYWRLLLTPRKDLFHFRLKYFPKFGDILKTWMGSKPIVHVTNPEYAEIILNNSIHIKKGFIYDIIKPWLGDGLLISTGKKWHAHRKMITPTFHFKILENFMDVFTAKSRILVEVLTKKANRDIFDMYTFITNCTLDIICETAMGVTINAMSFEENEYVEAIHGISEIIVSRAVRPWMQFDFIFFNSNSGKLYKKYLDSLHNFTVKVTEQKKKEREESKLNEINIPKENTEELYFGNKKKLAFLDLLLAASEEGGNLTDQEITEEVDTFMFEGHDTTTAAICWCLFLLGHRPELQEEVFKEVQSVFQECDEDLKISDLSKLNLLERCIKETLRLYPSVPVIGRVTCEDLRIGKYTIPSGCDVTIGIAHIHRNEKYYPNPDVFDPDRFLPENSRNRHPFAYLPFSAGPRNCIGQKFAMYEEKTILAHVLHNFKIKSIEPEENVSPVMDLILRPLNGLPVVLEKR